MNLPPSHRRRRGGETEGQRERETERWSETLSLRFSLSVSPPLRLWWLGGKQEKVMNRILQALLTSALLLGATAVAQAQWVVAFQDQSKRDLNGVFFMDGRYGWVIGDRGIIHTTQDNGGEWLPQASKLNDNISDIFFRNSDEGWLVTSGSTGSRILKS